MDGPTYGEPESARIWAAIGPRGGDNEYRRQGLRFAPIEVGLDERVTWQALMQVWARAAIVATVIFVAFAIIGAIVSASSGPSASSLYYGDTSSSGSGAFDVITAGAVLAFLVFWAVLLLSRTDEPIAEWRTLLEGKAAAATSSYAAIFGALRGRYIPVGITARRIRSDVFSREVVNNRLVMSERNYVVFVSVFAYGSSLYVGWMMWRSRRGTSLIATFLKDLLGSPLQRAGSVQQMLRTEKVRAMREAVHAAVREGVDVAVRGVEVSIASTFGHELPIENDHGMADAGAPPVPAQPPAPA